MAKPATPSTASLIELRSKITGRVLTADGADYATAISCWNLASVQAPAVVVVAENASDVRTAVRYAAEAGLGIGVQATGHGFVRQCDGMLIVTSRMNGVTIDPVAASATVGAGSTGGPVLAAAQHHGLVPLLGASPTVGAVGLTLGGGIGWLSRKYGPACDSVRSFEVVTPNGCLVHASATENDDLFRALRGGGGGVLGVVTSMVIDLFPLTTVYAGNLIYPASDAVEVAEQYAGWVEQAPDDLTSSLVFMNFPPIPQVPESVRGHSFTIVRGCWTGNVTEGRRFVDTFRSELSPAMDLWNEMPFADSATIGNDPVDPMPVTGGSTRLNGLDGELASAIATHTFPTDSAPPVVFSEIRHLGGAVGRNANGDSVMGNRDQQFLFQYSARATNGRESMTAEQSQLMEVLGEYRNGGTFLNFLAGEDRRSCTQTSTDPVHHDSLASLQVRLDPHNLMRFGVTHRAD
jgi:hypothetical protein